MAFWIDSHCHLDDIKFNHDLPEVLTRANQQGVQQFIVAGVGFQQWPEQQRIKTLYPNIFNAYGIHPWFCDLHQDAHLEQLDALLSDSDTNNTVAVGECGLDLMPNRPDMDKQLWWFQAQLTLAKKNDLPLIIHSVKASDMVVQQLKKYPESRGVIHGFSGSLQQANSFINLGFLIGIGTRLIQANTTKTQGLLTNLPLTSILLETDAPDGLGKDARNEPAHLIQVANAMAKLRNQDSEAILAACSKNAQELFQL